MSEGVIYWVPDSHWRFEIVGRGGLRALGLNKVSWRVLVFSPMPHTLMRAISEGDFQDRISPEEHINASAKRCCGGTDQQLDWLIGSE